MYKEQSLHDHDATEKNNMNIDLNTDAMRSFNTKVDSPMASASASVLSADLRIIGTLKTTGMIQLEGTVEGNIDASFITVGEKATLKGDLRADDIVIKGHIIGCVRGLKVRLTSTARVKGDIIHRVLAVESGADFDGLVQRMEHASKLKAREVIGTAQEPAAEHPITQEPE